MSAAGLHRWAAGAVIAGVLLLASQASGAQGPVTKTVQTIPPVPGAHFVVTRGVFTSDPSGVVSIPVRPGVPLEDQVRVPPIRLGDGRRAELGAWHGGNAGFNVFRRVRLRFTSQDGQPVPTSTITKVTIKASTGAVYRLDSVNDHTSLWLQSSRVAAFGDRLETKPIYYTFTRVVVRGANVVNDGQQKFFPGRRQDISVHLLFFAARFRAQDALFRFRLGSAVFLRYPDGAWERVPFTDGETRLAKLPRGDYQVRVDGPGYSFTRPMTLSRDQDLDLEVLSFFDLAVVFGVLLAFALGLLFIGRPHLLGAYAAPGGRWLRGRLRPSPPPIPDDEIASLEDVTVSVRNKEVPAKRIGESVVLPYRNAWLVAAADETPGGVIVVSVPRATSFASMEEAVAAAREAWRVDGVPAGLPQGREG